MVGELGWGRRCGQGDVPRVDGGASWAYGQADGDLAELCVGLAGEREHACARHPEMIVRHWRSGGDFASGWTASPRGRIAEVLTGSRTVRQRGAPHRTHTKAVSSSSKEVPRGISGRLTVRGVRGDWVDR